MIKILYLSNSFPFSKEYPISYIYDRLSELTNNKNIQINAVLVNSVLKRKPLLSFRGRYNLKSIGLDLDLNIESVNYIKIPKTNMYLNAIGRIRDIFFNNKCDLIHIQFLFEGYIGYLLKEKYGIPYVITGYGSDIHTDPFKSNRIRKRTVKVLEAAEKAIFVSNYLLEKAKELGYSGQNGVVIPNGVNEKKFRLLEGNPLNIRGKNELVVGFAGSLISVKRAERLPEIFFEISKRVENIKFLILGEGPLRKKIESRLKEFGIFHKSVMTGWVDFNELQNYFNNMDVLVLPSRREGWPCVVLEVQACGVPVVGSSNGGIPESIGEGGFVVDEGENFEKRFAEKVCSLLENPISKRTLIERAKRFSCSNTIAKEIEVYHSLIQKNP